MENIFVPRSCSWEDFNCIAPSSQATPLISMPKKTKKKNHPYVLIVQSLITPYARRPLRRPSSRSPSLPPRPLTTVRRSKLMQKKVPTPNDEKSTPAKQKLTENTQHNSPILTGIRRQMRPRFLLQPIHVTHKPDLPVIHAAGGRSVF